MTKYSPIQSIFIIWPFLLGLCYLYIKDFFFSILGTLLYKWEEFQIKDAVGTYRAFAITLANGVGSLLFEFWWDRWRRVQWVFQPVFLWSQRYRTCYDTDASKFNKIRIRSDLCHLLGKISILVLSREHKNKLTFFFHVGLILFCSF